MRVLLILFFLLSLTAPVAAGQLDDGNAAYERGDYETAFQLLQPLAEQGDAAAQAGLGLMHERGQGVPQDYAEAVKWYRLAAEQGDKYAQGELGIMYDQGQGVPQDYAEAVKWYRLAAEQDYAEAQVRLGGLYYWGQGVPQDYTQAHMWFNLAASQGSDAARNNLHLLAGVMSPDMIAEAQRLAREWKPSK